MNIIPLLTITSIAVLITTAIITIHELYTKITKAKIKYHKKLPWVKRPTRATAGSAGYDFYTPENTVISPGETVLINSGIWVDIPEGYVMLLYLRSSIGIKKHLMLANGTGVIDSDYQDTIKIAVHNYGKETIQLGSGERIAQSITVPYITDGNLTTTTRAGGLGSTGRF